MTEAETIEVLLVCVSNAVAAFAVYVSFSFAFLTAAFLVGERLTRFQALTAATLYVVAAGSAVGVNVGTLGAYTEIMRYSPTILNDLTYTRGEFWTPFMAIVQTAGMIMCLYFLYDVRNTVTTTTYEAASEDDQ